MKFFGLEMTPPPFGRFQKKNMNMNDFTKGALPCQLIGELNQNMKFFSGLFSMLSPCPVILWFYCFCDLILWE